MEIIILTKTQIRRMYGTTGFILWIICAYIFNWMCIHVVFNMICIRNLDVHIFWNECTYILNWMCFVIWYTRYMQILFFPYGWNFSFGNNCFHILPPYFFTCYISLKWKFQITCYIPFIVCGPLIKYYYLTLIFVIFLLNFFLLYPYFCHLVNY